MQMLTKFESKSPRVKGIAFREYTRRLLYRGHRVASDVSRHVAVGEEYTSPQHRK